MPRFSHELLDHRERAWPADAARCENYTLNSFAYFLNGERRHQRCRDEAEWLVFINPPRGDDPGSKLLCERCNRWDYQTFKRAPLAAELGDELRAYVEQRAMLGDAYAQQIIAKAEPRP